MPIIQKNYFTGFVEQQFCLQLWIRHYKVSRGIFSLLASNKAYIFLLFSWKISYRANQLPHTIKINLLVIRKPTEICGQGLWRLNVQFLSLQLGISSAVGASGFFETPVNDKRKKDLGSIQLLEEKVFNFEARKQGERSISGMCSYFRNV